MEQTLKHLRWSGSCKVWEWGRRRNFCFDPGLFHFKYSSVTEVITCTVSVWTLMSDWNKKDFSKSARLRRSLRYIIICSVHSKKKKKMRMWRLIYLSLGCHGQLARIPTIYREMNPSTCFNFLNDKIYRCIKMLVKIYTYTHTLRRFDYTSIFRKGEEKKKLDERWSMKKIRMEFKVAKWMCF